MKGLFPPFQRQRDRAPSLTRPFSGRYQLFPRFLSRLRFVLWQTKPRADVSEALQVAPVSSRNRRGRRPGSAASGRYQLFPPFPPQAPFCSLADETARGRFGSPASSAGFIPKPPRKAARQRRIRPLSAIPPVSSAGSVLFFARRHSARTFRRPCKYRRFHAETAAEGGPAAPHPA